MIDPNIAHADLGTVRFPVDRSKAAELARAFGDDDPVWFDIEAARAAGFDAVPSLPTMTVIVDHWRPGGAMSAIDAIGADLPRILHGEAAWEFLGPLTIGAEVTATQRVGEVSTRTGKRGGTMTLVELITDYTDADGTVVVRRHDTLIETGAS